MKTTSFVMVFENLKPASFWYWLLKENASSLILETERKKERKDFRFVRFEETTDTRGFSFPKIWKKKHTHTQTSEPGVI
jgi:hypothetical protein